MPGSQREVANAEEEGVEFVWLTAPKGLFRRSGDRRDGAADAPRARPTRPAAKARGDRGRGLYVEPADLVIKALGFEPEDLPTLWKQPDLEVTRWGTIKAEFRTHAPPAGCLRGGRHRARREPGGLGDPRRARGGGGYPVETGDQRGRRGGITCKMARHPVCTLYTSPCTPRADKSPPTEPRPTALEKFREGLLICFSRSTVASLPPR